MRSIKRRFEVFKKKNEGHGDYINFLGAVKGQNFSKDIISRWFTKLVPEDEYGKENREDLIRQLVKRSKDAEDDVLEGVEASMANEKVKMVESCHAGPGRPLKVKLMCIVR